MDWKKWGKCMLVTQTITRMKIVCTWTKPYLSVEIRPFLILSYLCGEAIYYLVFFCIFKILYNKTSISFIKRVIKMTEQCPIL